MPPLSSPGTSPSSNYCFGLRAGGHLQFLVIVGWVEPSETHLEDGGFRARALNPLYEAVGVSRCRRRRGNAGELAQDLRGAVEALFGPLPFVEEHHLHVGPHPRGVSSGRHKQSATAWDQCLPYFPALRAIMRP